MRELSTLARGIQRRWWLIAALALLGGTAATAANALMTPMYQARTSIMVGETLDGSRVDTRALEANQQVAQYYADLIPRRPVMEGVVETVELPITWQELARRIQVELPSEDPQLIVVTVEATSSREAEAIAVAVGDQLLVLSSSRAATEARKFVAGQLTVVRQKIEATDRRIANLQKQQDAATTPASRQILRDQIDDQEKMLQDWQENYTDLVELTPPGSVSTSLQILEKAHASPLPVSPRKNWNVLLSVTLGLMLAIPIAYILENRRASHDEAGRPARSAFETPMATVHEPSARTGTVFSARKAARACGVSLSTIRRHCRDRTFEHAYRKHWRWRIPVTDLLDAGLHVSSRHGRESPESASELDGLAREERPSQEHDTRVVGTDGPTTQPAPPLTVAPDASPSGEERP